MRTRLIPNSSGRFRFARFTWFPIAVLLIGWLVQPVQGVAAAEAATKVRLACVGDSITAGYALHDPAHDAYPSRLGRLLGAEWDVRNFGVSGATLMKTGNMPYDRQRAYAAALEWKPDVVVIALGTNDTKTMNIGRNPDDFGPSYRALLARFREANPDVKLFLCLPPPAFPAAMGISDAVLQKDILPRIRDIAGEEKLPLVDLHAPLETEAVHFPDRIHPDPDAALMIAQIVYGDVMRTTQPPAKSLDVGVNTAVVPVPSLERDSYNWWTRHAEELALGKQINPDVVLIGDSITHFWAGEPRAHRVSGPKAWAATFGSRHVLNLGFGWDRTQNVLWRLDHGEFDGLHPKLVIVNIGTNNFSQTRNARANKPEEVAEGIRAICDRVQQKSPGSHLLIMGVLPRGHKPTDGFRAPIVALNAILARTLANRPNTTFLDIGSRFLSPDGSLPKELMPDGTHPSESGYAIWGKAIVETGLLP